MTDTSTGGAAPPRRGLPLFYTDVRPVEVGALADKSLRERPSFAFAARANAAPLNGIEFALAQRDYPIVFAPSPAGPTPLAVLGLRGEENLFVDAAGNWAPGLYVPAYVRRWPFTFIEMPDGRFVLALEGTALADEGPHRLFDEARQPTKLLRGALDFCGAYQQNHRRTLEFCAALAASGILATNKADATVEGRGKFSLGGFLAVDEARFRALPVATLAEWREKGWLGWVYAHLFSQASWQTLARVAGRRPV